MFSSPLKPGQIVDNKKLCSIFQCSPQGGMRRSHKTNTLVIISNHVASIYEDKWINDILHYTGMGQIGDQSLSFAQNKTLVEADQYSVQVHLFEVFVDKEYSYVGQAILAGAPYQEDQNDANGGLRKVWMFPLKVIGGTPIVDESELKALQRTKQKRAQKLSTDALLKRASEAPTVAGSRKVVSIQHQRNEDICELAKRLANGICQLCSQPAPFIKKDGTPYLETHHIVWLSRGGEDSLKNTVALCPNCHRKVHTLELTTDVDRLINVKAQY